MFILVCIKMMANEMIIICTYIVCVSSCKSELECNNSLFNVSKHVTYNTKSCQVHIIV